MNNRITGRLELDLSGNALVAELEGKVDSDQLDIGDHARERARRIGTTNLVDNLVVPLLRVIRHRPLEGYEGRSNGNGTESKTRNDK